MGALFFDYGLATVRIVVATQPDNTSADGRIDQSYEAAAHLLYAGANPTLGAPSGLPMEGSARTELTVSEDDVQAFYRGVCAGLDELDKSHATASEEARGAAPDDWEWTARSPLSGDLIQHAEVEGYWVVDFVMAGGPLLLMVTFRPTDMYPSLPHGWATSGTLPVRGVTNVYSKAGGMGLVEQVLHRWNNAATDLGTDLGGSSVVDLVLDNLPEVADRAHALRLLTAAGLSEGMEFREEFVALVKAARRAAP